MFNCSKKDVFYTSYCCIISLRKSRFFSQRLLLHLTHQDYTEVATMSWRRLKGVVTLCNQNRSHDGVLKRKLLQRRFADVITTSSMQIEKVSTCKFSTIKNIKNFKVLVFSIYILRKNKNFFNLLAFPLHTLKKFKNLF